MAGTLKAEATLAAANLVFLLLLVGGGVIVPLDKFPDAAQDVLGLLPISALSDGLRDVLQHGAGMPWGDLGILAVWAVVGLARPAGSSAGSERGDGPAQGDRDPRESVHKRPPYDGARAKRDPRRRRPAVRNPLAFIAARWTPSPRTVRRAALAALVMAVLIVVTGGAVRLTGSGLGCPTWPKCTDDSLTATRAMGVHGVIEFGNRMLTYVLCAAVGWAIIAARSQKPYRRSLTRLGWAQFWVVMGNAVLGGIVVLVGLNPYTVAAHFLLSTALIAVATVMWQRTREGDTRPARWSARPVRQLVWVLVGATVLLIAVGTVVTGAGPHAGDSSEVERMPLNWENVTKLHAVLAWIVVTLAFALWFVLKAVDAPKGP